MAKVFTPEGFGKTCLAAAAGLPVMALVATREVAKAGWATVEATAASLGGVQVNGKRRQLRAAWRILAEDPATAEIKPLIGDAAFWSWAERGTKAHGPKRKKVLVWSDGSNTVFAHHVAGRKAKKPWEKATPIVIAQTPIVYAKATAVHLSKFF